MRKESLRRARIARWGIAVAFLIWWAVGTPPLPVIFAAAVVVAGFFVWIAEYLKSIPKFAVSDYKLQKTPMFAGPVPCGDGMYIQILPKCLSDAPILECKAYLIRVFKKNPELHWEPTGANEASVLGWSACDDKEITLESKAERRLNVCHSSSASANLVPDADVLHIRAARDLQIPGAFSFDIKVTGKDCAPVFVSLEVVFQDKQWDMPSCRLRQGLTMDQEKDESR